MHREWEQVGQPVLAGVQIIWIQTIPGPPKLSCAAVQVGAFWLAWIEFASEHPAVQKRRQCTPHPGRE
jgi:hypothetical protein